MSLLRWGLALSAFGPLFAAWPGVASPYTLPKLLVLALATAAASLGAARSVPAPARLTVVAKPDILRPLAACLGALVLSCIFSQDRSASLLGEYSQRGYGLLTLALCVTVAALADGAGSVLARFTLSVGAAAGAALAAFGLLQLAGLDPVLNAIGSISYGRVGSLVGSPIGLGCCLAMILPLQLRLALDGEDLRRRRMGWIFLFINSLGLLFTWSRGAWLAATIGLGCYLVWTERLQGPKTRLAGMKLAAATLLAAITLTFAAGRIRPTSISDLGRIAVWHSAWRMFAAHPLVGAGPDTFGLLLGRYKTESFVRAYREFGSQGHAHNDILQTLSMAGLAGLGAYAWLLGAAWRRLQNALRDKAQRVDAAAAGAGLIAAFIVAKFNPIPIDGLAMAAVLLGLLDPRGARPRGLPAAALTLTATGALASAWLMAADRRCLEGMRAQHEGRIEQARAAYGDAARMNPAEARYGFWLVGLIREQARTEKDPARRLSLSAEAVAAARTLEHWHPLDVRALHALGGSLASLALQGGPDGMAEAAAVLDRGAQADWSYRSLLETRLTVANLRKDARAKADTEARLARLDALRR
jgi:O-antigen ligase